VAVTDHAGETVDLLTTINRLRQAHGLKPKESLNADRPRI
jgi:hypothetical protein